MTQESETGWTGGQRLLGDPDDFAGLGGLVDVVTA